MPAGIWLHKFGVIVRDYFGHVPYQVGSSLTTKDWRDVDVRLILPDDEFDARFGDVRQAQVNPKLAAVTLAFCALGRDMTGLPIDFQIQRQSDANAKYLGPRSALIEISAPSGAPTQEKHYVIPTIGRIVIYKSKIDNGEGNDVESPAMVIRTRATTVPAVIDRWGPEPATVTSASDPSVTHETTARPDGVLAELPDDDTVDLLIHGLGKDYREYAVPKGDGLGQWSWPERV